MASTASALAASQALDRLVRADRGRLLSALIARLRDFQLAEDALQDALIAASQTWGEQGVPERPDAWLLRVAWRKALDRIRKTRTAGLLAQQMAVLAEEAAEPGDPDDIPDERLRLIFTCCHPALEPKSRVALTLRTLCGLSTPEIARAFLDKEATMAQRLARAKAKILQAGIPYCVPGPEEWDERLASVLAAIYLVFNADHAGAFLSGEFADEALRLARLLDQLRRDDPEIEGCLALMTLTHARREARIDASGASVPIGEQDRALWRQSEIEDGLLMLDRALARRKPGPYQFKAAIAACHCGEGGSDWPQIAALYAGLARHEPTPVVHLNWAVALAEVVSPQVGLERMEALGSVLEHYQPFHAARAEMLTRLNRVAEADEAYRCALENASEPDRRFLERRRAALAKRNV